MDNLPFIAAGAAHAILVEDVDPLSLPDIIRGSALNWCDGWKKDFIDTRSFCAKNYPKFQKWINLSKSAKPS